jgi:hypothetical protein
MSWQDDDSGWKGLSTFSELSGADNGTGIACLTPMNFPNITLLAKWNMCRCYFVANRRVREFSSMARIGQLGQPYGKLRCSLGWLVSCLRGNSHTPASRAYVGLDTYKETKTTSQTTPSRRCCLSTLPPTLMTDFQEFRIDVECA